MKERSVKYRKLYKRFVSRTNQVATYATDKKSSDSILTQNDKDIVLGTKENKNNHSDFCFTGKKSELNLDLKCSCKSDNKCKRSVAPKIERKSFKGAGILSDSSLLIEQSANYLASGRGSAAAELSDQFSGKMVARIKNLKRYLQKYINKRRTNKGLSEVSFENMEKAYAKQMLSDAKENYNKLSQTDKDGLLAIAPAIDDSKEPISDLELPTIDSNKQPSFISSKKHHVQGKAQNSKTKNELVFEFVSDHEEDEMMTINELKERFSQNEISTEKPHTKGGISNSGKSLFELIHTRYIKSAYPRFFDRVD